MQVVVVVLSPRCLASRPLLRLASLRCVPRAGPQQGYRAANTPRELGKPGKNPQQEIMYPMSTPTPTHTPPATLVSTHKSSNAWHVHGIAAFAVLPPYSKQEQRGEMLAID